MHRQHSGRTVAAALQRMAGGLRLVRELHTRLVLLPDNTDVTRAHPDGAPRRLRRYEFIGGGGATLLTPPPPGVPVSALLAAAVSRALASPVLLPLAQVCIYVLCVVSELSSVAPTDQLIN